MSKLAKESPLHLLDISAPQQGAAVGMEEIPFQGMLNLRGNAKKLKKPIQEVLKLSLPITANRWESNIDYQIIWLGPDEWMIITKEDKELAVKKKLDKALAEQFYALTDVTGGYTVIALQGEGLRDCLSYATTIDLHPSAFTPGDAAQTRLAQAPVLLLAKENNMIDIVVRRSFATYVWQFLSLGVGTNSDPEFFTK